MKFIKLLIPPIILKFTFFLLDVLRPPKKPLLFDGDGESFKKYVKNSKVYGEYGCGLSTNWVINNCSCSVLSVDTSAEWVSLVTSRSHSSKKLSLKYVDLGDVTDWGYPRTYEKRDNFLEYTDWIWKQPNKPDVVLIDGRFRVACFLTSFLQADKGTTIIFDDYLYRPHYHIVEEVLSIKKHEERQAIFIVPEVSDELRSKAAALLEQFKFVMN